MCAKPVVLSDDIENAIVKAFNLEGLNADYHTIRDEKGEIVDRFRVDSIIIIEFKRYYLVPVTLALTHRYEWYDEIESGSDRQVVIHHTKGLLLVDPTRQPWDRKFAGDNPIRAIDIESPVTLFNCLENMNILADHPLSHAIGPGNDDYVVHIYSHQGKATFSYWGTSQSKNMAEFHKATIETIKQMAQTYADEEILNLIKQGRRSLY